MELTLESLKSLLHSQPTLDEQREESGRTIADLDYVDTPVPHSEFYAKYIVANVPCLVGDWVTKSWLSTNSWFQQQSGSIHWDHLLLHFGKFRSQTK